MNKKNNKLDQVTQEQTTSTKTEASQIWEEIKDKKIDMFALVDQKVSDYCAPLDIEPSKLYLRVRATSVLPSLETALGDKFLVELLDKYVTVSRVQSK